MKRTLVLTFLALWGFTSAHAQQQFATLQHGDSISVYYGYGALVDAHNAAANGDVIILSPGSFKCTSITKAISIRGAGMFVDTVAGSIPTIIDGGDLTINIADDTIDNNVLNLEGLYFSRKIIPYHLTNPSIIKCFFEEINGNSGVYIISSASFINCIIKKYITLGDCSSLFVNSVILSTQFHSYYVAGNTFINCIVHIDHGNIADVSIRNCIIYNYINAGTSSLHNYGSFNSIGINTHVGYSGNIFNEEIDSHNLRNFDGMAPVFKYFDGTYQLGMSMELQDSIAATCLGIDGTQVGIYGGQFPFNPRVLNYSATVANQSRPDGKLEVTIQPINE